ncbi:unnamed protein product [Calypogeia fissa]
MDEEQSRSPSPVEMEVVEDKKSADKEVAAGKLVKLRAFNLFAAKIRDSIKDENPVASGHEIKRIVGQKWAQLGIGDKQEFIDVAQNENDLIEKLPVDPNAPKRRRRRRTKAEIEMDDGVRKRRGRPRKNGDGANGDGSNGLIPETEVEPKRKRVRQHDDSVGKDVDPAYIGKYGSGMGDGSFDIGYLVTIREGDTDMVFRGVIFDPYQSMATHNAHDAAPGVKVARRNAAVVFSPSGPASSSKQILGGPGLASGTMSLVK